MSIIEDKLPIGRPGGCASKLPSEFLDKVISTVSTPSLLARVIVGPESRDDAAVYAMSDSQSLVLSIDYGFPFCSDPEIFGAVAAANALSDIFAMGARPVAALSVLGAPSTIPKSLLLAVAGSAAEVCASVGVPIIGGHSAESGDVLFGLSTLGTCHPDHVTRNCTARAGDKIILTKPLGFGVYANAAIRNDNDAAAGVAWRLGRQLNAVGADLGETGLVNAMTDVTGFGLLGHLLEMARGSNLRACINSAALPVLPLCRTYVEAGLTSGATLRNRSSIVKVTAFSRHVPKWLRTLVSEPETNGGLLLSINSLRLDSVMEMVQGAGFHEAAVIGEFHTGTYGINVT